MMFETIACIAAAASAVVAPAERVTVQRMGLYVVSDDVKRSRAFYVALFGAPRIDTAEMVAFDVAGGLYAVVARRRYAPDARRGDTMRGYLKVADIAATLAHVKRVAPDSLERGAITVEGAFSFFRVRDPDGNLIEFFAVG